MLPGQLLDERYRLQAEAGDGGMGTVWRAEDTRIGRTVAIKVLHAHLAGDEELRTRFAREARAVGTLQHPGIVQLYDFNESHVNGETLAYLVMEFVAGQSLSDVLNEHEVLPATQALRWIAAAADGLHAAHQRGIIHRDVKPGNILVHDDTVKIVDFGISQSNGDVKLTSTGHFMGSLHYVSPEQLQGGSLTPVSDVYSLGVVAYQAVAGQRPFDGDTPASILSGHLHHEPKPLPPEVPASVAAVIMRALAKDPAQRYASAAEFAAACRDRDVDNDATVMTAVPPPTTATTRYPTRVSHENTAARPRRRWIPAAVISLVVVLLAATGVLVWMNVNESADGNGEEAIGLEQLHKLEQVGKPVPYPEDDGDDPGSIPEPVTADGVAYFTHSGDDPEIIAVDLATGKEKWRRAQPVPIGKALRANQKALYTADSQSGVVNFIDRDSGESLNVVETGGTLSVGTAGDLVVVYSEGSGDITAYTPQGEFAWEQTVDSSIIDLDIDASWRSFSTQPGRYSGQSPDYTLLYGDDGRVWQLSAESGEILDSIETSDDNTVSAAFAGSMFTAVPSDDGTYEVTMRNVDDDFSTVAKWKSLRPGHTPEKFIWCGKTRLCVRDSADTKRGAIVIDFSDTDSDPAWESPSDITVDDIYAAGETTAVVDNRDGDSTTQLYDSDFEQLGKAKSGTFRPVGEHVFIDFPRTGGDEASNPVGKHFFTGLDAANGSTRDLGMNDVFPQCVTDGVHLSCPTPDGIQVWEYRDPK